MGALRDCPACGRGFTSGFRAYVSWRGALVRRTVCRGCARKAERIIVADKRQPCMVPACSNAAHVCSEHHRSDVAHARDGSLREVLSQLTAQYVGIKVTERNADVGASDFIDGKLEGLETAIRIVKGNQS